MLVYGNSDSNFISIVSTYSHRLSRFMHDALCTFNEVRLDTDGLQKVCQIVGAIFDGINHYYQSNNWLKFRSLIEIANGDDFYNALQLPYNLLYQIKPDRLDEYRLLDSLEQVLCEHWNKDVKKLEIRAWAQAELIDFLEELRKNDMAYRYPKEFKKALHQRLVHRLKQHPISDFDPKKINLDKLEVSIKSQSYLEKLSIISFACFDMSCIPFFLNEWKLIELSRISERMGSMICFRWVNDQTLEKWVTSFFCMGFVFQLCEACRILCSSQATKNQKVQARWQAIVSIAEVALNVSSLVEGSKLLIIHLTFIAKSLGLMSILCKPESLFFEDRRLS